MPHPSSLDPRSLSQTRSLHLSACLVAHCCCETSRSALDRPPVEAMYRFFPLPPQPDAGGHCRQIAMCRTPVLPSPTGIQHLGTKRLPTSSMYWSRFAEMYRGASLLQALNRTSYTSLLVLQSLDLRSEHVPCDADWL